MSDNPESYLYLKDSGSTAPIDTVRPEDNPHEGWIFIGPHEDAFVHDVLRQIKAYRAAQNHPSDCS